MEASMVSFQIRTGELEQVKEVWREDLKEAEGIPGFQGGLLLVDPISGMSYSVGFWDSQQDAISFGETQTYRDFVGHLMPLLVNRPLRQVLQVQEQLGRNPIFAAGR